MEASAITRLISYLKKVESMDNHRWPKMVIEDNLERRKKTWMKQNTKWMEKWGIHFQECPNSNREIKNYVAEKFRKIMWTENIGRKKTHYIKYFNPTWAHDNKAYLRADIRGTVFAYGQTSSGKTHTMRGSPAEHGVIPLAVRDVFRNINEAEDREFLLCMSYMEIYNEEINDLLAPEHRKLQVHESLERGIFVAGLREEIVASPEQVLQLTEFGECHRHIGETNMNVYSSRSHTIFRMVIESSDKNADDSVGMSCDAVRVSVLNLVDLAGSERAAKTGAEGTRLKEGSHINKSLMTLGTVINKLSEGVESQG
ncbi:hypothetical protein KI387_031137, partial [Taxus chinensis]